MDWPGAETTQGALRSKRTASTVCTTLLTVRVSRSNCVAVSVVGKVLNTGTPGNAPMNAERFRASTMVWPSKTIEPIGKVSPVPSSCQPVRSKLSVERFTISMNCVLGIAGVCSTSLMTSAPTGFGSSPVNTAVTVAVAPAMFVPKRS